MAEEKTAKVPAGNIDELYEPMFKPYHLQKMDMIIAGIVFLVSFVIYLLTLTPYICAGDSGELTTAIYNLGAAHPPGYPLYTMLGKVFTYLPVSTIAYRVNLVSAFFGALTIPILYLFLIKLLRNGLKPGSELRDRLVAAAGSLIMAFSATMWSQAVIAEVYTLNIVFAPMLLLTVLLWQERVFLKLQQNRIGYAERFLLLFAFLMGMSFTNHLLLLGYIIPFFIFFVAVFLIIKDYATDDPIDPSTRLTILLVILMPIVIGAILIYKNAWSVRLLHDSQATLTLIGVLLPAFTLSLASIFLLRTVPDKRSYEKQLAAKRFLAVASGLLTALLLLIFLVPGIYEGLMFMKEDYGSYNLILILSYLLFMSIIATVYYLLKKRLQEHHFFTNSVVLTFKAFLVFLIPMLLYLTLIIRANAIAKIPDPPLSWGETADVARVLNHFLRKQYPKSSLRFFPRLAEVMGGWGQWHLDQFTPWLLLFVPFGWYALFRRNKLWAYLSSAVFVFFNLLLLYFLSFRVTDRDLFFNEVFFIPSYILVVTWMVFGMQFLIQQAGNFVAGRDDEAEVVENAEKAIDTGRSDEPGNNSDNNEVLQ